MTTDQPRDLLTVVDDLTLPKFEHVAQHVEDRWKVATAEVPPLLHLFRDAVAPSSNRDAGSASSKSTRSLIDGDALLKYAKMLSTAAGWAHDYGLTPTRDPVVDLRAWYSKSLADNARDDDWYRRHLTGWVNTIRDHLEPPERFVLKKPCPVCHGTAWGDRIKGGDLWPIEVRYRIVETEEGREHLTDHTAACRIPECGTKWNGRDAVMELADELAELGAA